MSRLWDKIYSFHKSLGITPCAFFYLTLLGVILYYAGFSSGPVFDDNAFIFKSSKLLNAPNPWVFWVNQSGYTRSWPLSFSFLWVIYKAFGVNYVIYNSINLSIHILNSCLFFYLSKKFYPKIAFVSALIFLIHPMQVETTCWIFQIKTTLATLLFFSSLSFVLKYLQQNRWWLLLMASVLLWASFESKPIAIFAPILFHILLIRKKHNIKWSHHLKALPFWIIMFLSIHKTVLGVVMDQYESDQKRTFQGQSDRFFSFFENIFSDIHSFFSPPTSQEEKEKNFSIAQLRYAIKKYPFSLKFRLALLKKNDSVKEHFQWIAKHPSTGGLLVAVLNDPTLAQHKLFPFFLDQLIENNPNILKFKLIKLDFLLKNSTQKKAKDFFLKIIREDQYSTIFEKYSEIFNLRTSLCRQGYFTDIFSCHEEFQLEFMTPSDFEYIQSLPFSRTQFQLLQQKKDLLIQTLASIKQISDFFKKDFEEEEEAIQMALKETLINLLRYEPSSIVLLIDRIENVPPKEGEQMRQNLVKILKDNSYNKPILEQLHGQKEFDIFKDNNLIEHGHFSKILSIYQNHILNQTYFDIPSLASIIEIAQEQKEYLFLIHLYSTIVERNIKSYRLLFSSFTFASETLGDYSLAIKSYKKLKTFYPQSNEVDQAMIHIALRNKDEKTIKSILTHNTSQTKFFYQTLAKNYTYVGKNNFYPQLDHIDKFLSYADILELAAHFFSFKKNHELLIILKQLLMKRPDDSDVLSYFHSLNQSATKTESQKVLLELIEKDPRLKNLYSDFFEEESSTQNKGMGLLFPLKNLSFYLTHFTFPYNNSLVYNRNINQSWIRGILSIIFFLLLVITSYLKRKYTFLTIFALFVIAIFPILGFYYVPYMKFSYVADHWAYLAIAPLALLISSLIIKCKRLKILLFMILILFYFIKTINYVSIFNDELKVLEHALKDNPTEYSLYMELGTKLIRKGRVDEAIKVFETGHQKLKDNLFIKIQLLQLYYRYPQKSQIVPLVEEIVLQLQKKDKVKEAIQIIKKALTTFPDDERLQKLFRNGSTYNSSE